MLDNFYETDILYDTYFLYYTKLSYDCSIQKFRANIVAWGLHCCHFSLSVDKEKRQVKLFKKNFLHSFYSEKKIPTKLCTQKKILTGKISLPPPRISNGPPLIYTLSFFNVDSCNSFLTYSTLLFHTCLCQLIILVINVDL